LELSDAAAPPPLPLDSSSILDAAAPACRYVSFPVHLDLLPSPQWPSPVVEGHCGEVALVRPRSRAALGMPRSRAAPGTRRSILCSPPSVDAADLQLPRGCSRCFLYLPPIAVRHGVASGVDGHRRPSGMILGGRRWNSKTTRHATQGMVGGPRRLLGLEDGRKEAGRLRLFYFYRNQPLEASSSCIIEVHCLKLWISKSMK
jgi:hypothetical protein